MEIHYSSEKKLSLYIHKTLETQRLGRPPLLFNTAGTVSDKLSCNFQKVVLQAS